MKLIKTMYTHHSGCKMFTRSSTYLFVSAVLAACGGGGGGGSAPVPEAVVLTVADAQVVEGNAGATQLEFLVTLDKAVVSGVNVVFSTTSTSKTGIQSTGSAKGGASCTGDTDYLQVTGTSVSIHAGASTGKLTVTVCGDTTFEPNETLKITWASAGSSGGSGNGIIVNDDAGGLNGTGATALIGGLPLFGRDAINPITNKALGFLFEMQGICIDDKVTGLTWQPVTVPAVTKKFGSEIDALISTANAASLCGKNDWRAPTANELLTLMDSSVTSGAINADRVVSSVAMTGDYWTTESVSAPNTTDAYFLNTSVGGIGRKLKNGSANVRLVSGSPTPQAGIACDNVDNRFVVNQVGIPLIDDGTVTDEKTKLMWKRCPEGFTDMACSSASGSASSYSSILAIVTQLNTVNIKSSAGGLGYSDWRVPTKNELASLVTRSCPGNPSVYPTIFPSNGSLTYITATLDPNDLNSSRIWTVDFQDGLVGIGNSSVGMRLRLVRAGQ